MNRREFSRWAAALMVTPGVAEMITTPNTADAAQRFVPNYDESKVPDYTLPQPLVFADGSRVETKDAWINRRRDQIYALFVEHVYGAPNGLGDIEIIRVDEVRRDALGGLARMTQWTLVLNKDNKTLPIEVLVFSPRDTDKPVPAFLGLNFYGNHTIHPDPAIRITKNWVRNNKGLEINNHRATEASRGVRADRWPVETIIKRGYALVTAYYGDIDPDYDDGFGNGLHALVDEYEGQRPGDAWGSIAAWAHGMSWIRGLLSRQDGVDVSRVAAFGHSRLGKTALWAGALDDGFAMAISNNSGCGGAALCRRAYGETIEQITRVFPHWFCDRFDAYAKREHELPVDQHELVALCAPRPVYIASAQGDRWADPRGEFLAAKYAGPVYELFGKKGVGIEDMPAVNTPVGDTVGYHMRTGKHDVTDYDWARYLDFADRHVAGQ